MPIKRFSSTRTGQSLVELTLTVTFMMFLMLAVIDFGFAFLYWITIRDAAQEGAMYGSLHPGAGCEPTLRNWVRDAAVSPIVNISTLADDQILVTRTGSDPGSAINVKVIHQYHILTPMVSVITGNPDITLSASISNTILQKDSDCP